MNRQNFFLVSGPIAAIVAGAFAHLAGQPNPICWTLGVTVLVAIWWVFEPIPIPATSLVPFALFPLGGVLTHEQVSIAYGHTLIILLMAGFILSTAMEKSGAHRRLALTMVRLIGGGSGRRLVLAFMVAAALLSMWISNTATVLMMLPVALAVLEKSEDRDNLAIPLLLGLAYAANIGGIGTPVGTPPNVIFMALFKQNVGQEWSFLQWMKLGVPIVFVFTPLAWLWLTRRLHSKGELVIPDPGQWRAEEARVLIVFAATALLWISRTEPFGGWNGIVERFWGYQITAGKTLVGDSTVALMMCVVMFVTPNGKGGRLLNWEVAKKVPWGLLLLFGGGMTLGMAFKESGLSEMIGSQLSSITTWDVLLAICVVCTCVTFLTEVTSNTATSNVLLPVLAGACMAEGGGWVIPPELLMAPAAISASCAFMLPVATAPNAIVFGTDQINTRIMIREGLVLNLIGVAVISLICYAVLA